MGPFTKNFFKVKKGLNTHGGSRGGGMKPSVTRESDDKAVGVLRLPSPERRDYYARTKKSWRERQRDPPAQLQVPSAEENNELRDNRRARRNEQRQAQEEEEEEEVQVQEEPGAGGDVAPAGGDPVAEEPDSTDSEDKGDDGAEGQEGHNVEQNGEDEDESQDDDFYRMDHRRGGRAVIFNHKLFKNEPNKTRHGTENDVESLERVLASYGYKVEVYNNLRRQEINEVLHKLSKADFTHFHSLLVVVLTHGRPNVLSAYDCVYPESDLWTPFTVNQGPTLVNKPKIFVIQACRGAKVDQGAGGSTGGGMGRPATPDLDDISGTEMIQINAPPAMADLLILNASFPGFPSFRNPSSGSTYIQALCKQLESEDKEDLMSILAKVRTTYAQLLSHPSKGRN